MSVLIKNMEMPSGCLSCDFCNPFVDEPYCRRLMRRTPKVTRLEDCPLVSVQPHGRLIDEHEILKNQHDVILKNGAKHRCFDTTLLSEIPAIIEAEEEQE